MDLKRCSLVASDSNSMFLCSTRANSVRRRHKRRRREGMKMGEICDSHKTIVNTTS